MSINDFATRRFAARLYVLILALASILALTVSQSASSKSGGATKHRNSCVKHPQRKGCLASISRRASDTTAPSVSWKTPAAGATVKGMLRGSACEVAASDNRGVKRVVYKVDGTTLNTELYSPWTCIFDTTKVSDGTHTLTATAYDAAGNSRSASRGVIVANAPVPAPTPTPEPTPTPTPTPTPPADTTPPSLAWTAPATGTTVKGQLSGSGCEVSASDSSGVDSVVFKVDGTTLNTERYSPWECEFKTTTVADGAHTLTAIASDKAGNSRSLSITVTVANAVVPAPTPEPTPTPTPTPTPSPSPTGMIVGLDAGNYGSSGAADVRGAVNTVRYDSERGVSTLENFKKAGLRIQMQFPGPYNSGGVCALNATTWVADALSFYKANTNPTQTPIVEALNEPGGSWFWGPNATSSANATCYRELLKKTYAAFHGTYGDSAPKILGTLDGVSDLSFGKMWVTSDWRTYVDGFVVHPYGGTGSKSSSALGNRARVEDARAMTGGPIYITEVGWPTAVGQSSTGDSLQWTESEQATNITNFIAWCHSTGYVAEVIYFNYHDFGTNNWYGVVRSDGSHKPSYESLRQAAAKYGV